MSNDGPLSGFPYQKEWEMAVVKHVVRIEVVPERFSICASEGKDLEVI